MQKSPHRRRFSQLLQSDNSFLLSIITSLSINEQSDKFADRWFVVLLWSGYLGAGLLHFVHAMPEIRRYIIRKEPIKQNNLTEKLPSREITIAPSWTTNKNRRIKLLRTTD